jgi:glucose/arabinose dehydrogenase
MRIKIIAALLTMSVLLAACGDNATETTEAGSGSDPKLPPPVPTVLIPTVNVAKAVGWPKGKTPAPASGLSVGAFAEGLDHPRWLYTLPNGDVLVAESNAPARPDNATGIKGWVMGLLMSRVGASAPSAERIKLLRDADGDGIAELKVPFLTGLRSPFGMALIGSDFYVANTDAVLRFPYGPGATSISAAGVKVADLPAGTINHHWTKNIIASPDGKHLYATVGSNSNVAESGMDKETNRAAILEIDLSTGQSRIFASGLRNPNGLAWQPQSGALWTTVNERDELGSDLVPDYMTSVKDGAFYGWPYSYYGQHADTRPQPPRPDLVAKAISPDYALGAHTASLGLAFSPAAPGAAGRMPDRFGGGAFIGQHGSWNRSPPSGYKVVFVPFAAGKAAGPMEDVLTGFRDGDQAYGRPVGVAIAKDGALLVADDVGNTVWRVTAVP